jgi:primosomal protein N' (replication factor Y)
MNGSRGVVRVAVPAPLRSAFDYLAGAGTVRPGARVRVPFGRRSAVGVVVEVDVEPAVDRGRLKPVTAVVDEEPILPPPLLKLLRWAADYYHYPIGEVVQAALPTLLRRGAEAAPAGIETWAATDAGRAADPGALGNRPLQRRLLALLVDAHAGVTASELRGVSTGWRTGMGSLADRGWVARQDRDCLEARPLEPRPAPRPTAAQAEAVDAITGALGGFAPFLLHGVTGSGKTEVYRRAIEATLAAGRQALVLVPEIGLTPQLVERFRRRFAAPIAVLHSRLSDPERLCAWSMARTGRAPIVLGTRSAVFTPLARPGLIVIDEEHDGSFKQQDGFRYHARDVALMRARDDAVPVVLGSATPALETLHNARRGRYRYLTLPARVGTARLPQVHLLDLRRLPVEHGLSRPLREALAARLAAGEQSLLFLNRRGFAPTLMCYGCGWIAPCARCDARLTLHKASGRLCCHHCGAEQALPAVCPRCGATELHGIGAGTERIEQILADALPEARVVRIDRDTTSRKGALEDKLEQVHRGEADILVGTQMLAKGHHFPNVTLVAVMNADQGLFGSDFRAGEYLFQQIVQVAGRAGRSDKPGVVLIQTWHPDSPYFAALVDHDYDAFARFALEEREAAGLPPFTYLALLRAESPHRQAALDFLGTARDAGAALVAGQGSVTLMDPVPSSMERRAGRYRAQLLVSAPERSALHRFLRPWIQQLESLKQSRNVRWSIDVDPTDMH